MKVKVERKKKKKQQQHQQPVECPYRKQLESNHPHKYTNPYLFEHNQACALLHAIELNQRKRLNKRCLAHLSLFVAQAWEDNPSEEKVKQLYYMMNHILDTTVIDKTQPLETALKSLVCNPLSTPTVCSSVALLIALNYVERLNKQYRNLKGTAGCGSRMIMIAYIIASKYIHKRLSLVIYTKHTAPLTPPVSPKTTDNERNQRMARMEQEFLFFLNYDLSIHDPVLLVKWAQSYDTPAVEDDDAKQGFISDGDGDDELDDDDDDEEVEEEEKERNIKDKDETKKVNEKEKEDDVKEEQKEKYKEEHKEVENKEKNEDKDKDKEEEDKKEEETLN